jgi:hypothetical protein
MKEAFKLARSGTISIASNTSRLSVAIKEYEQAHQESSEKPSIVEIAKLTAGQPADATKQAKSANGHAPPTTSCLSAEQIYDILGQYDDCYTSDVSALQKRFMTLSPDADYVPSAALLKEYYDAERIQLDTASRATTATLSTATNCLGLAKRRLMVQRATCVLNLQEKSRNERKARPIVPITNANIERLLKNYDDYYPEAQDSLHNLAKRMPMTE